MLRLNGSFTRDLSHAGRALWRHPGYTAVAVLSLALGIGANTAVFSLLSAFVLRPLPYPDPERLAVLQEEGLTRGQLMVGAVAAPVLRDWRERSRAFTAIGAFLPGSVNLGTSEGATRVAATFLEPDALTALGVAPLQGRLFPPSGTAPVQEVVLSHALWRDRFGGRQDVSGQPIRIEGSAYVVTGVMPAQFDFPPRSGTAVWLPLFLPPGGDRGNHMLSVIARLKPDVSWAAARQDMASVSRDLEAIYPNSRVAWLRSLHEQTVGRTALVLVVLAGAVGFVLVLACANVAHMVLARASARRHEFAVRLALGATRGQVLRLLLAEGFILAVVGGALGLLVCRLALDALLALPDNPLPPGVAVSVDSSVLGYCALMCILTAVGVSLLPALRMSRQTLQADLAEAVPSSRRRSQQANRLITVEVAVAMLLAVGAGMLVRSLRTLTEFDLGFSPRHILTMRLSLPREKYPDTARLHAFHDRLLERLSALPGVEAVGLNNLLPVQMSYANMDFTVEGWPDTRPGYEPFAEHRTVSPDFFRAMGIPIVAGRAFTQAENRFGGGVIVISRAAAAMYWRNQDPIGKRVAYGTRPKPDRWLTIVGVAGDIKSRGLGQPPQVILYAPYRDFDYPIRSVSLIVRTAADPAQSAGSVRHAVRELDPDLAPYWVSTMDEVIARATAPTRYLAVLMGMFSALSVLLAIVGVYGVMSYVVGQRQREIGVRMAMGASREEILRFVLGLGVRRTLIGLAIGAASAVSLSVMMRPFLIGVGRIDVVSHAGSAAAVLLVALAACALPAYRATRVDPIDTLRHE